MSRSPETLARYGLLSALAASQLTLAVRAQMPEFAIMASLSWMGGAILVVECEEEGSPTPLVALPRRRFWVGLLLLLWPLVLLTFGAQLHDSLLYLVPMTTFSGLGLLAGETWLSPLFLQLVGIGALLPAQGLFIALIPDAPLAGATARISSQILWLLGNSAFAEGIYVVLSDRVLGVHGDCTGVRMVALCLASAVMLLILFPIPVGQSSARRRHVWLGIVALLSFCIASVFVLNAVRISMLAFTTTEPQRGFPSMLKSFSFWHDGLGSNLFLLMSVGLVCMSYSFFLEFYLRSIPTAREQ